MAKDRLTVIRSGSPAPKRQTAAFPANLQHAPAVRAEAADELRALAEKS
ncbi:MULTISPECIES: hypothetical protein [unclassified Streptomyces]